MAELEARKLKYANIGTEALLMGVLIEGLLQIANGLLFSFNNRLIANGIFCFAMKSSELVTKVKMDKPLTKEKANIEKAFLVLLNSENLY